MTQFLQVHPNQLRAGNNIRDVDVANLDDTFLNSIRDLGVVQPLSVTATDDLTDDGQPIYTVVCGHRRTLAAQHAGLATVPVLVTDAPQEADRLITQWAENEHRANLTTTEKADAVAQMALTGLSEAKIAKATGIGKNAVKAALKASKGVEHAREAYDSLTLEQAAMIVEFDDDADAVRNLLDVAGQPGRFEHLANQYRRDRAYGEAVTAATEELQGQGLRVIEYTYDCPAQSLARLKDEEDHWLDADHHRSTCPGHVAWFADHAWGWKPGDCLSYTEGCENPEEYGHTVPSQNYGGQPEKKKVADMTEEEREEAKQERRSVIANNKAWAAATELRREWLATQASVKTAHKDAAHYLVAEALRTWPESPKQGEAFSLLGWDRLQGPNTTGWNAARALHNATLIALAQWEATTHKNTWRAVDDRVRRNLTMMRDMGYKLSELEETMTTAK